MSGAGEAQRVTVAIADDHAVVREGLRLILARQSDMEVVGEAKDVAGALEMLAALRPDVLLLDINLGGESGLEALPRLRAQRPETAVVILTMQKEPLNARHALNLGAVGYVLKESAGLELVRAIRTAAAGGTYLEPEIGAALVQERVERDAEPLTAREREVIALIARGHTNAEVAAALFLSVRTVESHRARIREKLGLSGRAELMRYAQEHGLVDR
ncbi:MAG TPA: response regulator transcription factor [Thermoleophilaceae bacterium]